MMGERTVMQEALFYSFRIEDHVPQDHLLRSVERFVDGKRRRRNRIYSVCDATRGATVDRIGSLET